MVLQRQLGATNQPGFWPRGTDLSNPIVFYDGVCGLCNRLVQFSLQRDANRRLHYASLQSDFAAKVLRRHGFDSRDLDTVYFVEECGRPEERLSARSDAVISVLQQIGGPWSLTAALLRIVPRWLRNWGYNIVAHNRYSIFGKSDSCLLPEAKYRDRFLDL
jgi:predicted DCC family thiol-disulfide oxidoreductase YuxK